MAGSEAPVMLHLGYDEEEKSVCNEKNEVGYFANLHQHAMELGNKFRWLSSQQQCRARFQDTKEQLVLENCTMSFLSVALRKEERWCRCEPQHG